MLSKGTKHLHHLRAFQHGSKCDQDSVSSEIRNGDNQPLDTAIRIYHEVSWGKWICVFGRSIKKKVSQTIFRKGFIYHYFGIWILLVYLIELDDGKIYSKPLYLMVKTMVSLKPIH